MSIYNFFENELVKAGLWPKEVKAVMSIVTDPETVGLNMMTGRWNTDISLYPRELIASLLFAINNEAINYLEQNKPNHFALFGLKGQSCES